MLRAPRSRRSCSRIRLHHAATLFIACLALAHLLITYWTIQYEEVWAGLSPGQKLVRAFKVLLVDAYMPRTKLDNRGSCPVADHIPKVCTFCTQLHCTQLHCTQQWSRRMPAVEAMIAEHVPSLEVHDGCCRLATVRGRCAAVWSQPKAVSKCAPTLQCAVAVLLAHCNVGAQHRSAVRISVHDVHGSDAVMLVKAHCALTGFAKSKTVCRIGRSGPLHEQVLNQFPTAAVHLISNPAAPGGAAVPGDGRAAAARGRLAQLVPIRRGVVASGGHDGGRPAATAGPVQQGAGQLAR